MNAKVVTLLAILILALGTIFYATRDTQTPVVGGDRDQHGCIPSAGYSWCEAKQKCIRPWEEYCTAAEPKTVTFTCEDEKTIAATFYVTDDKFVDLVLSDGRALSLAHATSASGARYAREDESIVFWNKGDAAFVTEGIGTTSTETFRNCVLEDE